MLISFYVYIFLFYMYILLFVLKIPVIINIYVKKTFVKRETCRKICFDIFSEQDLY